MRSDRTHRWNASAWTGLAATALAIALSATAAALQRVLVARPYAADTLHQYLRELLRDAGESEMQVEQFGPDDLLQILAALPARSVDLLRNDPRALRVLQSCAEALLGDSERAWVSGD